jgi:hypothetical protein
MVKIDREIRMDAAPTESIAPDPRMQAQTRVDPESVSMMLNTWLYQDSEDVKLKATKIYAFPKFAEFSQNPNPENSTMFSRAMNKLKSVSSTAADAFCTILGAPQTAEAAVPAIIYPIIANVGIFLAENPDFWSRMLRTGASLPTLFNMLEQKKTENILFRSSDKSRTGVSSPSSSSGSRAGGSPPQPPEPDDKEPKNQRKTDTHETQLTFIEQQKAAGKLENIRGYTKKTLRNTETGDLYQPSVEKWEIEVYSSKGVHKGIIRPSEGIVRTEFAVKGRVIK